MTIKEHRKRLGLTQKGLAELLGISYRNVENWEQGHRTPSQLVFKFLEKEVKK